MCLDCFGSRKKQSKNNELKRSPRGGPNGLPAPNEKQENSGPAARVVSSPSRVKTCELTVIYEIPSKYHSDVNDIIAANGYELGDELGKGSYATVYKVRRTKDNKLMACKMLRVDPKRRSSNQSVKNELFILERINHPNIIKLYQHFIVDKIETKYRYVYIFMQLAEGNSLSIYMRNVEFGLPEVVCKRMFAQMVSALNHMHQKGIAHRDLKMGNVLLNKNLDCLITDFGLSRVAYRPSKGGTIMANNFCGTVHYMAPEIILTKKYHVEYNPFVADIWALGVVLYCIINRGYPFGENATIVEQQMSHKIRWNKRKCFEPGKDIIDLLYKLLDPNVEKRIKMNKLMAHRWIADQVRQVEDSINSDSTASKKSPNDSSSKGGTS